MPKTSTKLNLSPNERISLRKHKVKIADILDYATDELEVLLSASSERAREVRALTEFQSIPSIGIKFAEDLIFLGYYSVEALAGQNGAQLTDAYEKKKGHQTDPCVEDQFRLIAHVANSNDKSKNWWEFTSERKKFRSEFGYPKDRPKTHWTEVYYV